MSALRRALHQAVDLILDAIEEDRAGPVSAPVRPPRKSRERRPVTAPDTSDVSPELRARVEWAMRKNGAI